MAERGVPGDKRGLLARRSALMKSKRVVVTGGAGFIGSHLAAGLAGLGYDTVILDDLSSGRQENAEGLSKKGIELIEGSVTDLELLRDVFRDTRYVFHQAALPSVPRSIEDPLAAHQANLTGTIKVLIAARDNRVRKVIYASSSSVYGDSATLPKQEDMPPRPLSPYAVTKVAGEYYCQVFSQVYNLPTVCLRYFNVYGPRQDPYSQYAAVIPGFLRRLSVGMPPVIFGDGEQTRDFTFVGDVVSANILAAESSARGVFNVGGGKRVSVNRLARLAIRLMGEKGLEPVYEPPRPGDVRHSQADISRAREFGYRPSYDLEKGLKETIGLWHES
jgi:UDP-glucose 4-epimerase